MPDLISPWWLALLALASYRFFRLIAEDTILDKPRRRLLRLGTWDAETDSNDDLPDDYREEWGVFITCPYCAGFWISGVSLLLYSLIIEWHGLFAFLVSWFAISALVAFLAKTDELLVKET